VSALALAKAAGVCKEIAGHYLQERCQGLTPKQIREPELQACLQRGYARLQRRGAKISARSLAQAAHVSVTTAWQFLRHHPQQEGA